MPKIATQQDAALVSAMARQAIEDGALMEEAILTEDEARAMFAVEAREVVN